ncbi:MAG TPA: hypothetical protein VJ978_00285 [Nitriliruptoraceae bacterium]|nr:hypothetical protein [Nitriliruptoraceae bacterium]
MHLARTLTHGLEAIHALAYFDRDVQAAWAEVGLKGYWMGYFASRAAPMGEVTAGTVEATFASFAPRLVRRAIPDAWTFASPAAVLMARDDAVADVLEALWADQDDGLVADVAARCRTFAQGIDVPGARGNLPLYAANAAREWDERSELVVFHAATLAREYRGDLHQCLLVAHDVDPIEANVLAGAGPYYDATWIRQSRSWDDDVWDAAVQRLVDRDWLSGDGDLTDRGRDWRRDLERRTDELAAGPVRRFGTDATERLVADLAPLVAAARARLPASAPQAGGG